MDDDRELDTMSGVVRTVAGAGDDDDTVAISEIVDEIGDDAFGPLMLVPALIMISPASGVPGLSSIGGLVIALIAVQMVFGRRSLWLPTFISKRTISRSRLEKATSWLEKPARFIDRLTKKRLSFLTRRPFSIAPALICLCAGLIVPFFELIPFSATIIATAVALFALGFVTQDGLLMVFATAVIAGAICLAVTVVL